MPAASFPSQSPPPQSLSSPSPPPSEVEIHSLKRRLAQAEEENEKLRRKKRSGTDHETSLARASRKYVSLHTPLKVLVNEWDRRLDPDEESVQFNHAQPEDRALAKERDRNFNGFKELEKLFGKSNLARKLEDPNFLQVLKSWEKLGDDARGTDIRNCKSSVADWLNGIDRLFVAKGETPEYVDPSSRGKRSFRNNMTGRLLCPIHVNWDDPEVRRKIKDMDGINFPPSQQLYPRMLYAGYRGNPMIPHKRFLMSTLMVRCLKLIFTSNTSALRHNGDDSDSDDTSETEPPRKRQRVLREPTKKNVASRIGMTSVTPRAIAYTAVMLHFALSSAESWNIVNEGFNYAVFYDFIVDYLEVHISQERRRDLLNWWNAQVFPAKNTNSSPGELQLIEEDMALREIWSDCAVLAAQAGQKRQPEDSDQAGVQSSS
ncbi:hypothetical protein AAF712_016322 [Marasmius tenuissimus]|uniref:Uncharacterized protein n=1 Tax=Marasmius tenuissimus TaxID=585030 RepID=A0ABR2Z701_9AGAR